MRSQCPCWTARVLSRRRTRAVATRGRYRWESLIAISAFPCPRKLSTQQDGVHAPHAADRSSRMTRSRVPEWRRGSWLRRPADDRPTRRSPSGQQRSIRRDRRSGLPPIGGTTACWSPRLLTSWLIVLILVIPKAQDSSVARRAPVPMPFLPCRISVLGGDGNMSHRLSHWDKQSGCR